MARELALTSIDDYANYVSTSGHLDFIHAPAKHQRLITRALDLLLSPLDDPRHPKDRWGEPVTRLLLTAPPGAAKSTYCSVQAPTYILAKHPEWHILCASNTIDLAENFNRRRREAIRTTEWQRLAHTTIDPEASSVSRFFTKRSGSVVAAGVQKAIVGVRSNVNILDDPIKSWEEAQSETQLMKIWDWYETEYRTRLVPDGVEIMMHQRWARNDPAGIILRMIKSGEERGWMVVNLPMEAREDPDEPDPMARAPGELLWPEWFTNRQVTEAKRDPAKWAALYQQHPLDEEGGWVDNEHINIIQPHEWEARLKKEEFSYLAAGDLSLKISAGDWTVLGVGAVDHNRNLIICGWSRQRKGEVEAVNELYRMNNEYPVTGWCFDDDNITKVWSRLVYEHARAQNVTPVALDLMPMRGKDKEIRAAAIRGYFRSGRVFIVNYPWAADLIREILGFPGEPDDQIDVLGLMGRKMVQMSGRELPKPKNVEPLQGAMVEKDGQPHLSLGLDKLFEEHERGSRRWNNLRIG